MAEELQRVQGDSNGIALDSEAIAKANGGPAKAGIRETLPDGDLSQDAVWKKAQSVFQTQASEAQRQAAAMAAQNEALLNRLSALEQVLYSADPNAAQTLADAAERAEKEWKAQQYDAFQQQQAQTQQWLEAARNAMTAANLDPSSDEAKAAIAEASQAGQNAYIVLSGKIAEMVARKAAPPKQEPQQRQVPESNIAVPPAGGAPAPKGNRTALEAEYLQLRNEPSKNKKRLAEIVAELAKL